MFPLIAFALVATTPTTTAANRLLGAYSAAWSRADAAGLAALYTADGELVSPAGTAAGRVAIARLYGGGFANGMAATLLTARLEGVRTVAPGVVFGRGGWRLVPRDGGAVVYCGRYFAVLRRDKRVWRIASFDEVELACDAVTP